jgi:hypothetical protein
MMAMPEILRPVMLAATDLGTRVPCDFFDMYGNLLLCEGIPVDDSVYRVLVGRRLFCRAAQAQEFFPLDPLVALTDVGETLSMVDAMVAVGDFVDAGICKELATALHTNWLLDPDACIGFTRVAYPASPSVCQAVLAALFAAELGSAHAFTRHEIIELVGAALTMNLGSMGFHDEMAALPGPLPSELRPDLIDHPRYASMILQAIGVPEIWTRAVLQHHENVNGSGYPEGLAKSRICLEARMLRLVDIFAARLRRRRGRGPRYWSIAHTRDLSALTQHVFGADLNVLDLSLARLLMGRLGAFPPGSVVRLSNGELAVINRRAHASVRDATHVPREVLSFLDAHGRPQAVPRARRIGPHDHRIQGYAHDDQHRLPTYDWAMIWGYRGCGNVPKIPKASASGIAPEDIIK